MMELLSGGNGVIEHGYFYIKPEVENETWQVNTEDFKVEVQTDLKAVPRFIAAIYVDDKFTNGRGFSIIYGNAVFNSSTSLIAPDQAQNQSVPFTNPEAKYLYFDENTGVIRVSFRIWSTIKVGKWMWMAVYNEENGGD